MQEFPQKVSSATTIFWLSYKVILQSIMQQGLGTSNSGVAVALRILYVALTVGEKGVALIVGENLSLKLPLFTRLSLT